MDQQAPAGMMRVDIRSDAPIVDGMFILARFDCERLGLKDATLLIDEANDRLALVAPCGCLVHLTLSNMLGMLALSIAKAHGASPATTH